MQIRCASCGRAVTVAATGVLPERCPHCEQAPVPDRLGRWRVERLLAAGGMGEVYVARHLQLGSRVAIKLLPRQPGADAQALRERFAREARLTAAIDHPGVVRVLDYEEEGERAFLVLELVDGRSLRSVLRDGPLPVARAAELAAAVADVLAAAHARGVVHRDVKPENVIVTADGAVRVLDFGIARAVQDREPLTRTGEILGTPEYMAPEQLLEAADAIDARTDVHALGVLLHELLTGASPFHGANLFQVLKLVESLVPQPPSRLRAEVLPALDEVVGRALAKTPGERHADAAEFAAAVRRAAPAPGRVAAAGRGARVAWAAAVAAAFALGAWLGSGTGAPAGPVEPAAARTAAGDAAALAARGRAALLAGELRAALADLDEAARRGDSAAAESAAAAWVCAHRLLPALIGAPAWLAECDRTRRDRLLGIGADAAEPATPLARACRDLALGDARAALATLRAAGAAPRDEVAAVVTLLAARLACADRDLLRRAEPEWRPAEPGPTYRLLLAGLGSRAELEAALEEHAAELAAHGSDRWLTEACAVYLAADRGAGTGRLRAAAELAWLTGAGAVAPIWFAGLRLDLAARDGAFALDGAEAARALALVGGFDAAEHPALAVARALLQAAGGQPGAAPGEGLAALADVDEAALRPFRALGDTATPARRALGFALAQRLIGRAAAAADSLRSLLDGDDAVAADAHLALATLTADAGAAAVHWRHALAGGADLGLLAVLNRHTATAPTAAALPGGAGGEALLPALRELVLLGADPADLRRSARPGFDEPPLRAAWVREVQGGIDG